MLAQAVAPPAGQQLKVIGQSGPRGCQAQRGHAHGRQFDGQGIAIELPTQLGCVLQCIGVVTPLRIAFARTGQQQANSRREREQRSIRRARWRQCQHRDLETLLAGDAQRATIFYYPLLVNIVFPVLRMTRRPNFQCGV